MLKRLVLALALTTGLSLAQAPPVPATVFLSPFLMTGDYKPVTQEQLNQVMADAVKEVASGATVVWGSPSTKTLSDSEVVAQARAANCRYAFHGSVEFSTQNLTLNATGGPGPVGYPGSGAVPSGSEYRYLVTVKGHAEVNLLDVSNGQVLAEHPESLWRSQTTQAPLDTEAYDDVEAALAKDCVTQLSHRLMLHLKPLVPKP